MKKVMKSVNLMLILLFGVSTISITSCGWKAGEEDIKQLEETKSAALSAEKSLADKKAESEKLASKVKAKNAELEKIKADKEKVKAHLEESAVPTEGNE